MINKAKFFKGVRDEFFGGKLSQGNVDGMSAIINAWEVSKATDKRWLAYILATAYHETAKTMMPVEEYGRGQGRRYGGKIKMNGKPYKSPNKIYYGRGHVQLTWYENYLFAGNKLDLDLLNHPEYVLTPEVSASILVKGMIDGWFTGKKLKDFINDKITGFKNARKIINGLDKADLIAGYAFRFIKYI